MLQGHRVTLHNNIAIVVTLGGIREVFYGADGTYTAPAGRTAINCIDLKGVGSFREEMPRFGGIAKPSGLQVTLGDRGGLVGPLLSRTIEGVTRSALAATVPAETDTATITLRQDVSGFPAAGYLYLGHETVSYSARNTETKTFTVTERGALGSVIMEHEVNSEPDKSYNPLATTAPVAWKGRKAIVTLHEVNGARVVSTSGVELVRGFLVGEPEPMPGGSWSIVITQEIAKFDNQIADTGFATKLRHGKHFFFGDNAKHLLFQEFIPKGSVVAKFGQGGGGVAIAAAAGGDTLLDTGTGDTGVWSVFSALFPTDPSVLNLVADRFVPENEPIQVTVTDVAPLGQPDGVVSVSALPDNIPEGTGIYNQEQTRTINHVFITNGLKDWPACAVELFNDTFAEDGADFLMLLVDAVMSADGRTVTVKGRHVPDPRNVPSFRWDWANLGEDKKWTLSAGAGDWFLWYPWLRHPDDETRAAASINAIDSNPLIGEVGEGESAQYRFPPVAKAFWQRERYILVQDSVFIAATTDKPGSLRVKDGSGFEQVMQYVGVFPADDGIGFYVELSPEAYETERFQPFGDWPDKPECVIEPYVAFVKEDPRVLLLRIMLSGYGEAIYPSAEYSTLPRNFGLAVDPDAIDIEGILAFPIPVALRELSFRAGRPASAREMLDPILQALGAALVMRQIGGVRKITLVRVRTVDSLFASATMPDGDWLASDRPGSGKLDDVINVYRLWTNYNADEDKFAVQVNFFDRDSIDLVRVTADVTLKLRGVEVEPEGAMGGVFGPRSALVSIYKTLRAQGGLPVRQFTGGIGWSVARNLSVGSILITSIAEGRALDGSKGITSAAMLVDMLETNPVTKAGTMRLLYQGRAYTGIAPSASVIEVVDSDTVRLSANVHSDLRDLITNVRQYDWSFFVPPAGYSYPVPVRLVHTGDESNNTDGTITTLVDGLATIPGHGLSVGDRIRSANWTDAAGFLRVYAFLTRNGVFTDGASGFLYS